MKIKVPAGFVGIVTPAAVVEVDDGRVSWRGETIGYVWKGTRRYSPPTYKGSRIVRYHKDVPEWHADRDRGRRYRPEIREDTRQYALQRLIGLKLWAERENS